MLARLTANDNYQKYESYFGTTIGIAALTENWLNKKN